MILPKGAGGVSEPGDIPLLTRPREWNRNSRNPRPCTLGVYTRCASDTTSNAVVGCGGRSLREAAADDLNLSPISESPRVAEAT